jgi:DNA-binding MarR family transcriptional regulator
LQKLRELEYNALKYAVVARKYIDIARSLKTTPSYVSKLITGLERKGIKIYGKFDYASIGLIEYLMLLPFSQDIMEKNIPYIIQKTTLIKSKQKILMLRALIPDGAQKDFADILQADPNQMWRITSFSWNPYSSPLTVYTHGKITSNTLQLTELLETRKLVHTPPPKQQQKIDNLDLELVAEFTRNPFLKLSQLAQRKNMKNQTLNYHYTSHVKPIRLENEVIINPPPGYATRLLQIKTTQGHEEHIAWALSSLHYVQNTYALTGTGTVYTFLFPDPYEEKQLAETLYTCTDILDFTLFGYVTANKRYTVPFGDIIANGRYNIGIVYEALHVHRRKANYDIYEL